MDVVCKPSHRVRRGLLSRLRGFGAERRGSVSPMLTLMIIPLVGMLGMATEASSWFFAQRSMQAAADAAVMAAATNGCDGNQASCIDAKTPYYDVEARSVARSSTSRTTERVATSAAKSKRRIAAASSASSRIGFDTSRAAR